jgi:teichoic acid transport system permease protein
MQATVAASHNDEPPPVHVFQSGRYQLPPLRPYFRDLWSRRRFAVELARTGIKASHADSVFGSAWLVLNPLLLALVYFMLVQILGGKGGLQGIDAFLYIVSGLFLYTFVSGGLSSGASSVVQGSRLMLNIAFPRLLLPMSAVLTAWRRFLPTLVVLVIMHAVVVHELHWQYLWAIPLFGLTVIFTMGVAAFFGAVQVYFRDMGQFLPYFLRIWLYLSPVIWSISHSPGVFEQFKLVNQYLNPLYSLIGGWNEALIEGRTPPPVMWVMGTLWSVAALVIGCLYFMSRERDFAVRI